MADLNKFAGKPHFIALEVSDAEGNFVADNFYCVGAQDNVYDWKNYTWYDTPITSQTDLKFAFNQAEADVQMTIAQDGDTYTVTLVNNSPVVSYMNILKAKDDKGELVVPAYWSDNFITLLPGQTKTLTCKAENVKNIELDK